MLIFYLMSSFDGGKQIDLYDFFSVLLPGLALTIGLVPFLPNNTDLTSVGAILPILTVGFVAGRGIHSAAVIVESPHDEPKSKEDAREQFRDRYDGENEITKGIMCVLIYLPNRAVSTVVGVLSHISNNWSENISHREMFFKELSNSTEISNEMVSSYLHCCREAFDGINLPESASDIDREQADVLYDLTRSTIHIDSRGRSRTFQAVYAFYRSMWMVSLLLVPPYVAEGLLSITLVQGEIVSYQTIIGSAGIPGPIIIFSAFLLLVPAYYLFERAKSDYRRYYIKYLFADLIVIERDD